MLNYLLVVFIQAYDINIWPGPAEKVPSFEAGSLVMPPPHPTPPKSMMLPLTHFTAGMVLVEVWPALGVVPHCVSSNSYLLAAWV